MARKRKTPELKVVEAPEVEATEATEEVGATKSVVPLRFRQAYQKRGGSCGDSVAQVLRGTPVNELVKAAVQIKLIKEGQYSHLNLGMQRMNVGNRLRGLIRKTDITETVKFGPHEFQGECTEVEEVPEAG